MVERVGRDKGDLAAEILSRPLARKESVEFLHSGSTMLNLAASGKGKDGGWARARVDNVVGDGGSGKTLLALEFAFRCYKDLPGKKTKLFPRVMKLEIVYDNVETVMDFPIDEMYGEDFVKFVTWRRSTTVEDMGVEFFRRVNDLKKGHCLIYIIDSWDNLDSEEDLKKFEKQLKARIAGKKPVQIDEDGERKEKGSYELGKQRYASKRFFKKICEAIEHKDVTLFIVSQVKRKIGVTFGKQHYRAGGDALNYFTHQVCWLYEKQKLRRLVKGIKLVYGIDVTGRFERNKTAKPFREAGLVLLLDYGVDDLTSMINWVYGPGVKEIKFDGAEFTRETFISHIEDNNLEDRLIHLAEEKWFGIEEALKPDRKPKV